MTNRPTANEERALRGERRGVLAQLGDCLETPMLVLGFVWLALMLWGYVRGVGE